MLIEQIIKFELEGPGPPGRTCTPITGYSYGKTKTSQENLRVDYYLLLKKFHKAIHLAFPYLGQITCKI